MGFFKDPARLDVFIVWALLILLLFTGSFVVLYINPSYPLVILMIQMIEIVIFANMFILIRKIRRATSVKKSKAVELLDMEADT